MSNDFKAFATAGGANVISQATYAAAGYVSTWRGSGILPSDVYNKICRQGSIGAYLIGQLISDNSLNALDDGDLATLLARFKTALRLNTPVPTRTILTSGSGN